MYISTNEYLKEFVSLTKEIETKNLSKEEIKLKNGRRNYIRAYLKDHRNVNLRSSYSYLQLDLLNLARATSSPELLDSILNKIKDDIKEVEKALSGAKERGLKEEAEIAIEKAKDLEKNSKKNAAKIIKEIKAKARLDAKEAILVAKIKLEDEINKAKILAEKAV